LENLENRAFAPALLQEVDMPFPNRRSQRSGLHIENAAEFVSMESLLGNTP
jgi:hypothetical protein